MESYTVEQIKEMIESGQKVLVDFKAEWCAPCRNFVPIFEEVSGEKKFSDIKFVKCDVDENAELATKYGIRSIPAIILFEDGEIKSKHVGLMSKFQLEEFLS
jgi:thioredoxin 1